jgi:hypothetical protein
MDCEPDGQRPDTQILAIMRLANLFEQFHP